MSRGCPAAGMLSASARTANHSAALDGDDWPPRSDAREGPMPE